MLNPVEETEEYRCPHCGSRWCAEECLHRDRPYAPFDRDAGK